MKKIAWIPEDLPNSFTLEMGQKVRIARNEQAMSFEELATRAYLSVRKLSDIEDGKDLAFATEVLYLANALEKSILYFFPEQYVSSQEAQHLRPEEVEFLRLYNSLGSSNQNEIMAKMREFRE